MQSSGPRKIKLTRGKYALVDLVDYEWLSQWKWYCSARGYAARRLYPENKVVYMHRVIIPEGEEVDHINHDKLDNRKSNLRPCTHKQNLRSRGLNKNNKSGYKGVGGINEALNGKQLLWWIT